MIETIEELDGTIEKDKLIPGRDSDINDVERANTKEKFHEFFKEYYPDFEIVVGYSGYTSPMKIRCKKHPEELISVYPYTILKPLSIKALTVTTIKSRNRSSNGASNLHVSFVSFVKDLPSNLATM